MANKLTRKRPNRLLTGRNNYYSFGSFINNVMGNPKDGKLTTGAFKGMSTGAAAGLQAAGTAVGQLGGSLIGGGMTSGAGNVLQGLSGVAAAIPGPWGAVASAGLGLLGGFTNRAIGSKMNPENIAEVEANINSLNNFQSNASDFDTLSQNWANADVGMTFSDSFIGKDGWFSNKAKNKAADLRRQVEAGNAWVQNSLNNNAESIGTTQMQNLLANYAAFGGPLFAEGGRIHIKPENRGKFTETKRRTGKTTEELTHSKNPVTRKRAIFALNSRHWNKHSNGGTLAKEEINPGLDAIVKARLALDSHFGNPTARRMTNYDTRSYTFPDGRRGNVYVGSYGNYVTPQIQDVDGELKFIEDPWSEENWERSKAQSMKFESPRDAEYFAKNYKRFAPMMSLYSEGGIIQNAKKWHHAFGGDLMTHGADFPTGLILVGNGGTHEENPNEGVPMGMDSEGIPNLVEEGEVIFNDYVFSKRLKVPKGMIKKYKLGGKLGGKKDLTFADAALQMSKESEERPNDPISQNGLEALLGELAYTQEGIRERKKTKEYAQGGYLFYDGGRKFGQYTLNPYGWVRGYNAGNWMVDGNYTDDYKRRIRAMKASDWQQHLKDQFDYYSDPTNKGTDRYKAINYMYEANPWMKDYTVTDGDVAKMANLALSNPGFMHPYDVLQRQLDAEAHPNNTTGEQFRIRQKGAEPIPFPEGETPWLGRRNGYLYGEDPDNPANYKFVASETKDGVTTHYYDPIKKASPKKFRFYDYAEKYDKNSPYREYDSLDAAQAAGEDLSKFGAPKDGEEVTTYRGLKPPEKMPEFDSWLRYVPIGGQLTGLGLSLLKPGESGIEAILEASRGARPYQPVKFNPVGNHLTNNPFDLDYAVYQANAEAAAARRAIMNTSGGNRAQAMAGILAADNNALNQLGVLRRGAAEDNLKQKQMVEDFNRATNMFNSEGFFKADAANQQALAQAKDFSLRGTMAAEEIRQRARLAKDNAIQANLSSLFRSIGNIGQENVARQQMRWMGDNGFVPGYGTDKKAKGGKIKRRKKGLTY